MEQLYYYAGYDRLHRDTGIKNFYWDTKENIVKYLTSTIEFKDGTSKEAMEESIELMFECYTKNRARK